MRRHGRLPPSRDSWRTWRAPSYAWKATTSRRLRRQSGPLPSAARPSSAPTGPGQPPTKPLSAPPSRVNAASNGTLNGRAFSNGRGLLARGPRAQDSPRRLRCLCTATLSRLRLPGHSHTPRHSCGHRLGHCRFRHPGLPPRCHPDRPRAPVTPRRRPPAPRGGLPATGGAEALCPAGPSCGRAPRGWPKRRAPAPPLDGVPPADTANADPEPCGWPLQPEPPMHIEVGLRRRQPRERVAKNLAGALCTRASVCAREDCHHDPTRVFHTLLTGGSRPREARASLPVHVSDTHDCAGLWSYPVRGREPPPCGARLPPTPALPRLTRTDTRLCRFMLFEYALAKAVMRPRDAVVIFIAGTPFQPSTLPPLSNTQPQYLWRAYRRTRGKEPSPCGVRLPPLRANPTHTRVVVQVLVARVGPMLLERTLATAVRHRRDAAGMGITDAPLNPLPLPLLTRTHPQCPWQAFQRTRGREPSPCGARLPPFLAHPKHTRALTHVSGRLRAVAQGRPLLGLNRQLAAHPTCGREPSPCGAPLHPPDAPSHHCRCSF